MVTNWANTTSSSLYPPYSPLLSSLYNLTLPSIPADNRALVEQSLVQRLSGLSGLHHNRHPFLGLQRPPAPLPDKHHDIIRATDTKDDNDDDDDDTGDDEEKRKKKKTRTVFSRSQVS